MRFGLFLARLEASSLVIGAVTAVPAVTTMLASLPASAYVERQHDHVRTTVRFSLISYAGFILLPFLPFVAGAESIPLLVVVLWSYHALLAAIGSVAWLSVLGAVISSRRRPMVNGARWALSGIFTGIFVALFRALLDAPWLPFPLNYQVVFFISALSMFGAMALIWRMRMPVDYAVEPAARRPLRERAEALVGPILRNPQFMKYLGATFVLRMGIAIPMALYSIFWVHHLGASDSLIGLRTTAGQVSLVIGYVALGRLAARNGHRGILLASGAGMGLYPIATALSPSPIWLVPAALLWGFFNSGINISFFEALFETTPPAKRPSFGALYVIFANLANFVGPLLGAALMGWLGIRVALFIAGALHLVGAGLCWRLGVGARR